MAHLKDHVVVCNWNPRASDFVRALHSSILGADEERWLPVAIVAEALEPFPDEDCFEDTFYVPGSPLNLSTLKRANVEDARAVVIVANPGAANPDDLTLRTALRIRTFLGKMKSSSVRVVAEVQDPSHAAAFRRRSITGLDEIVCEQELNLRVLAQTSITPGLTLVLNELLEYSESSNELYSLPIPETWLCHGKKIESFADIQASVRRARGGRDLDEGVLVLGMSRRMPDGEVVTLICPSPGRLAQAEVHGFENGDCLIVLARTPQEAKTVVEQMSVTAGKGRELPAPAATQNPPPVATPKSPT